MLNEIVYLVILVGGFCWVTSNGFTSLVSKWIDPYSIQGRAITGFLFVLFAYLIHKLIFGNAEGFHFEVSKDKQCGVGDEGCGKCCKKGFVGRNYLNFAYSSDNERMAGCWNQEHTKDVFQKLSLAFSPFLSTLSQEDLNDLSERFMSSLTKQFSYNDAILAVNLLYDGKLKEADYKDQMFVVDIFRVLVLSALQLDIDLFNIGDQYPCMMKYIARDEMLSRNIMLDNKEEVKQVLDLIMNCCVFNRC